MSARAFKNDEITFPFVNQQPIRFNVAFSAAFVVTYKGMVIIPIFQRCL